MRERESGNKMIPERTEDFTWFLIMSEIHGCIDNTITDAIIKTRNAQSQEGDKSQHRDKNSKMSSAYKQANNIIVRHVKMQ